MTSKGKISSRNMWGIGNVIGQKASSHVELNVDINVDQLVYAVYDLTPEEIAIVEGGA